MESGIDGARCCCKLTSRTYPASSAAAKTGSRDGEGVLVLSTLISTVESTGAVLCSETVLLGQLGSLWAGLGTNFACMAMWWDNHATQSTRPVYVQYISCGQGPILQNCQNCHTHLEIQESLGLPSCAC